MPNVIDRARAQELRDRGALVIEVLPEQEYGLEHIAGAINIPLDRIDAAAVANFPREQEIVVYCNDGL
jgi:rhodanese-related sulfurtransferase